MLFLHSNGVGASRGGSHLGRVVNYFEGCT